jgi:hypothetical protein
VLRTSKGSVCPQDERTSRCCDFVHPPRAFVNYNFALNEQRTATTKIPLKSPPQKLGAAPAAGIAQEGEVLKERQWRQVHPVGSNRGPVPPEVPEPIAADYVEACRVLLISPKASAAMAAVAYKRCFTLTATRTRTSPKKFSSY